MALKSRTFACPDCEGQFTVLLDDRDPLPNFCQVCGNDMTGDPTVVPFFSRVGKAENQTLDRTYRQIESSSAERAQMAADMQGVPVSEMANIRVTDMKDNIREGESSYIAPPSQEQAIMRGGIAPVTTSDIAQLRAAQAPQGPAKPNLLGNMGPSPGSMTLNKIRPNHSQRVAQLSRAGCEGVYKI